MRPMPPATSPCSSASSVSTASSTAVPEQDWSLRLTLVFRRVGDRWQIVHRHADPLVHDIPFDHLAELARGLDH